MTRAEAARDIATGHSDDIPPRSQHDPALSDRERHLNSYVRRQRQRRRDEKANSLFGIGLSVLMVLTVTQVSMRSSDPVNWLDIAPGELIINELMTLVQAPSVEPPESDPARDNASRADMQHLLTAEQASLDEEQWEEQVEAEASDQDENSEVGRAIELEAMPIIKPQDAQPVDSTTASTSMIRLLAATNLPGAEGLDQAPRLLAKSVKVRYPWDALRRGLQGLVVVHFFIDSKGRTSSIRVLESSCPPCDGAAVRAIERARFTPGRQNGKNVGTYSRLGVRFILN
jgi:TonB family protein